MDFCHLWLRCRCIILIRTILVLIRTLFFRILSTPLPFQRSSPSWKKSHRVILQSWWLTEMGPFEPLCSLTHWWPCAGFTANELVKETWVNIPLGLVRTFFVYLRQVEKPVPTHLQGCIERLGTVPKLCHWSFLSYSSPLAKSLTLDFLIRYFKKTLPRRTWQSLQLHSEITHQIFFFVPFRYSRSNLQ